MTARLSLFLEAAVAMAAPLEAVYKRLWDLILTMIGSVDFPILDSSAVSAMADQTNAGKMVCLAAPDSVAENSQSTLVVATDGSMLTWRKKAKVGKMAGAESEVRFGRGMIDDHYFPTRMSSTTLVSPVAAEPDYWLRHLALMSLWRQVLADEAKIEIVSRDPSPE